LLIKYPSLKVELSSHTDARGNTKSNQILSNNRAKACYKYLVEKRGINPRRIIPVGKGKSEPLKIFDEISNQMILLNESYINQFESDVQKFEDLHQLNRRTEVRILDRNFNPINSPKAPANYLIFEKMP
jgi:outer membrane protein OmpA-like peptidoglycan-associated protein